MTPDQLFAQFSAGFTARRFSAGLLTAFIDFYLKLGIPGSEVSSFSELLEQFPRREQTAAGKRANTLIVSLANGETLSLRPFYNEAERLFRAEHKRFEYPSCAPHATQARSDYEAWLDALATFNEAELKDLRARVEAHVLEHLPSHAFDPTTVQIEPPLFRLLLQQFDLSAQRGEPTGAAFQGVVFGFLRADNPHLQVEIDKVRTGSKRLQRVGDIDCWEGARLAISAEVKPLALKADDVPDLAGFANETGRRGALGIVVASGFYESAREELVRLGVKALDTHDLLRVVELWDPLKQRTAVASLVYYARHVEKNASLAARIDQFLDTARTRQENP
jgi:hypothetical protein